MTKMEKNKRGTKRGSDGNLQVEKTSLRAAGEEKSKKRKERAGDQLGRELNDKLAPVRVGVKPRRSRPRLYSSFLDLSTPTYHYRRTVPSPIPV